MAQFSKNSKYMKIAEKIDQPSTKILTSQISSQILQNVKKVGNYILGKILGKGSFGRVYLGLHILTGQRVAIKIIDKSKTKIKEFSRIKNQIQIMSNYRHTNMVHLYEIIQTQRSLLLITEYLPKGQLYTYIIKNKKLVEKQARIYFHQLLNAINYLHSNNIIHRDIKPSNIMMDFDNRIKIIDFGMACSSLTKELLSVCGSPYYSAPEIQNRKEYDPIKADVWSCGVVLFVMLCGKMPNISSKKKFRTEKLNKVQKQELKMSKDNQNVRFSNLSQNAADLIDKMLKLNPNQRISISDALSHKWFQDNIIYKASYGLNKDQFIETNQMLLHKVQAVGYKQQQIIRSLETNKKNQQSATYYILMKKYIKQGLQIQAYIGDQHFNSNLLRKMSISTSTVDQKLDPEPYQSKYGITILKDQKIINLNIFKDYEKLAFHILAFMRQNFIMNYLHFPVKKLNTNKHIKIQKTKKKQSQQKMNKMKQKQKNNKKSQKQVQSFNRINYLNLSYKIENKLRYKTALTKKQQYQSLQLYNIYENNTKKQYLKNKYMSMMKSKRKNKKIDIIQLPLL